MWVSGGTCFQTTTEEHHHFVKEGAFVTSDFSGQHTLSAGPASGAAQAAGSRTPPEPSLPAAGLERHLVPRCLRPQENLSKPQAQSPGYPRSRKAF